MLDAWLENLTVWRELPALAMGGRAERRSAWAAADMGRGWALFNSVTLRAPLPGDPSDTLESLAAFYKDGPRDGGELRLWSAWPTPNLMPWGWRRYDQPWMMTRPAGARRRPLPPGLTVEAVTDQRELGSFVDVVARGFEFDDLRARPDAWDHHVLDDARPRLWLGRLDGEPVTTSATVVAGGFNGVTLVATLPGFRGRGFGAAMASHAADVDPALPAGLLAGALPRPVYERLGFVAGPRFDVWARAR